jgi:hypothetical protein
MICDFLFEGHPLTHGQGFTDFNMSNLLLGKLPRFVHEVFQLAHEISYPKTKMSSSLSTVTIFYSVELRKNCNFSEE